MSSQLNAILKSRHSEIYERATKNSERLLQDADTAITAFFTRRAVALDKLCFAVVGSVGRAEALEASDLDLIPIAADEAALAAYQCHDGDLRAYLKTELGVKISKGADLTKATSIDKLVDPDTIGGESDNSAALTKRILVLTEGRQAGGGYDIASICGRLVDAYASEERTSGRHNLAMCNDIARYYKTLCIEYKSKIDDRDQDKDWCTRNVKLRHSRKFWYFSNIMAIAALSELHPQGGVEFRQVILDTFAKPPIERLLMALNDRNSLALGRLLENYASFLEFMAIPENRDALAKVQHDERYDMRVGNPFLAMKYNSDLMHSEMLIILEDMGVSFRGRVMSWFML